MSEKDAILEDISFTLNTAQTTLLEQPNRRLSDCLRNTCNQTDVKVGCNAGDCGACSVLIDGESVCSCLVPISQVTNRHVETVSGLVEYDTAAKKVADAFIHFGAVQCGICTPGMLVAATSLLKQSPQPSEQEVADALGGVLCRCTGYRKIIDAVINATELATRPKEDSWAGDAVSDRHALISIGDHSIDQSVDHSSNQTNEHSNKLHQVKGGVGVSIKRVDALDKVNGCDVFGDDGAPATALTCFVIRSPFHHADFAIGNTAAYLKSYPGIERVITANDIPGDNCFGVIPPFEDQPVFAERTARFKGEAVAAVIGTRNALSSNAISQFPVEWQERVAHLDMDDALADDASMLHDGRPGNVMCNGLVKKGDIESAFKASHVEVSGDYQTDFIEHAYIEPEAGYAELIDGKVTVHGCTQTPHMNRDSLARILGVEPTNVRMVATSTGGGFGSKLDLSYQPYVALAAWLLKKPVRLTYSRRESMQSTTKRHPSNMHVKVAADKQGKLTAFEFSGDFNTGAYASWGPTVANRVPVHASGPYYVPNYLARTKAVHTHTVPAGAFRGFGVPQAAIAQECLFDKLADRLGVDRLEFRIKNALDNNQETATGQRFKLSVGIKPCLESLQKHWDESNDSVEQFNKSAEQDGSYLRRGIGVASGWYGCGNTSLPNPSTIKAGIQSDGSIFLHQGAVDIGQGSNTVITQIFASALGVDVDKIQRIGSDTDITPDAGKTSASRQTFVSGNAARLSGAALRKEILRLSNCGPESRLEFIDGKVTINDNNATLQSVDLTAMTADSDGYVLSVAESYDPPTEPLDKNGQGVPYAVFGYAAHLVELEVDIELGKINLCRFVAAHDVGKAINPNLVEGQIHGGIAQGIGLALMESYIPARTENLHDYLIPTIGDVPPIESIIVEVHDEHGPYGAKGLGEHVLIPTAPAILNAIRHACGAEVTHLPATPDKVHSAIQKAQESEVHQT